VVEFAVALGRDQHASHLTALGEDDLVHLATIESVEEVAELAHRFAQCQAQIDVGAAAGRVAVKERGTSRQVADRALPIACVPADS
jgi:hypothetical protein